MVRFSVYIQKISTVLIPGTLSIIIIISPFHAPVAESLSLHCASRLDVHGEIHGNAGPEPRRVQYIGDF